MTETLIDGAKIRELHASGLTATEIARELRISRKAVFRAFVEPYVGDILRLHYAGEDYRDIMKELNLGNTLAVSVIILSILESHGCDWQNPKNSHRPISAQVFLWQD